nr:MAG TPA: hypothetical protein [Caudoviricetes sp.]
MAGKNKLEILINAKSNVDSAINKIRGKMRSILPVADNVEKKVGNIGNNIHGSGIQKLRSKMVSVLPTVGKVNGVISRLGNKINANGVNNLINRLDRIPFVGKKISGVFDKTRDKINRIIFSSNPLANSFKVVGKAVQNAFKAGILSKFIGAMKKVGSGVKSLAGKFNFLKSNIAKLAGMIGIVVSLGAAVNFVKESVSAYQLQSQSEQKLQSNIQIVGAYKKNPNTMNKVFEEFKGEASRIQSKGVYGDELVMAGQAQLSTFQLTNKEINMLMPKIADIVANQKGMNGTAEDFYGTANMIGKAMSTGQLAALRKVGIALTDNEAKQFKSLNTAQRAAMMQQILERNVGNVNEALANTPEGKIQQAKNLWGDMQEEIGKAAIQLGGKLAPGITAMIPYVQQLGIQLVENLSKGFDVVTQLFSKLNFAPLMGPLATLGNTIMGIFNSMSGGKGLTDGFAGALNGLIAFGGTVAGVINGALQGINFEQVGQIIGNIGNAFSTLFQTIDFGSIGNLFGMTFNIIMQALTMITPLLAPIMQTIGMIFNFIVQIATAIMPIIGVIIQVGAVLLGIIVPVVQVVIGIFIGMSSTIIGVFSAIIGVVASIMSGILGVVSGVINAIGGVINQIAVFFTNAFNKAKSVAQSAINGIKGFIDGLFGKIGELGGKISNAISKFNIFKGFGIGKSYIGAKSWRGGLTTVAEKGAEMIKLPGGQQFLAGQEMLMNLPQGTEISTAETTRGILEDGLSGMKKTFSANGKASTTNNSTTNKGNNNKYVFSPTIVIENTGENGNELEKKVKKILREFFDDSFAMMGG